MNKRLTNQNMVQSPPYVGKDRNREERKTITTCIKRILFHQPVTSRLHIRFDCYVDMHHRRHCHCDL